MPKRGDIHPVTGLLFWALKSKKRLDGSVHTWERWCSSEEFAVRAERSCQRAYEWRDRNPDKVRAIKRANYSKNRDRICAMLRAQWIKHRHKRIPENKAYREAHRDELRIKHRTRIRERYKTDPVFRLKRLVARRIRLFLSGHRYIKEEGTFAIIGCTPEFLKTHIESLFKPGMSWENQCEWQIDHRIPLKSAETKERVIALCHYTNLQPLWSHENLAKGSKILAA